MFSGEGGNYKGFEGVREGCSWGRSSAGISAGIGGDQCSMMPHALD